METAKTYEVNLHSLSIDELRDTKVVGKAIKLCPPSMVSNCYADSLDW